MNFTGKRILVTGGASGIGAAVVRLFAGAGARVVAVDRDGDKMATVAGEIGASVIAHAADVSERAQAEGMVRFAVEAMGGLDILVNNAGIGSLAPAAQLDPDEWRKVLSVDLDAVFYACRVALPHLIESSGCIVNTASISGMGADYGFTAYNSAKAGVIGLTRNIAIDYAGQGVRCNCVSPGYTATPLVGMMPPPIVDAFIARVPMKRAGTAGEMADAIAFLASEQASYITGQNLAVDGGITAHTGQPDIIGTLTRMSG